MNTEFTKTLLNYSMNLVKCNYNYNFGTCKGKGSKPLSMYETNIKREEICLSFR